MILGAAYNVFDGVELLEGSINSIRENVDFICVVFQDISNYGNKIDQGAKDTLNDLLNKGLIDDLFVYTPIKNVKASINEIKKRNRGKELCEIAGCTHFMTIDTDEYYLPGQFKKAKNFIEMNNITSSACQMLTYYKERNIVLYPPEEYYVPFIYKLDNREFKSNVSWQILADPTRKLESNNVHPFERDQLQMHHFSYVRDNIRQKLANSSALINWENRVSRIVDYFEKWEYPEPALLAGSKDRFYEVRKIKSLFP